MKVFFVACMLLDYIALCNVEIANGTDPDTLSDFMAYYTSGKTGDGQTMKSAVRNIGPEVFEEIFKDEGLLQDMFEVASSIKINWRASQTTKNAKRIDEMIAKRMIH